jgi:uncharacterized membrane protein
MQFVAAYIGAALAFLALDALWLGVVAKDFYFSRLGALMRDKPDFGVAALFYSIYVAGILYFAIVPALAGGGWMRAALNGALFGFLAYATYDLTNLATLRGYAADLAKVDIAWGTILTTIAATAGYWAARRVAGS